MPQRMGTNIYFYWFFKSLPFPSQRGRFLIPYWRSKKPLPPVTVLLVGSHPLFWNFLKWSFCQFPWAKSSASGSILGCSGRVLCRFKITLEDYTIRACQGYSLTQRRKHTDLQRWSAVHHKHHPLQKIAGPSHQHGVGRGLRLFPRNSQAQEFKKLPFGLCPPAVYVCFFLCLEHSLTFSSKHCQFSASKPSPWGSLARRARYSCVGEGATLCSESLQSPQPLSA